MCKGYTDSKIFKLPQFSTQGKTSLEQAINERVSVRDYAPGSLTLEEVSQLLWACYGKNKGKKLTAPSAGALYPLKVYLAAGEVENLSKGFYKYDNQSHSLILISFIDLRSDLYRAALNQRWVESAPILIVICADYDIMVSHYGGRGRRYVDIEVGHAGENLYLQAQTLGLSTVAVGAFDDNKVKGVLNVEEEPLYIMPVGRVR